MRLFWVLFIREVYYESTLHISFHYLQQVLRKPVEISFVVNLWDKGEVPLNLHIFCKLTKFY